jgi:hypothetical protein
VGDGGGELLDLGGGQEVHLAAGDPWQPYALGGVAGQPVGLDRGREHLGEHLVGVADARRRQVGLDQGGQPRADQQRVDAG